MHRISAALACLAVVVTAGCGTARATTPRHPAPLPCRRANNVITQADSGKTYCVRVGDQVTIILHSTQKNLWLQPLASGNVPLSHLVVSLQLPLPSAIQRPTALVV